MIPAFVGHPRISLRDQRQKNLWIPWLFLSVKGSVGGADGTLAVYAINAFNVLSSQDLSQLTLDAKKYNNNSINTQCLFSFLSFFFFSLVTVLGNTLREESPYIRGSRTVLDSGFHALDSKFQVLDSSLC